MTPFADRLAEAVRRAGNPLCVGLDPRWESLPGRCGTDSARTRWTRPPRRWRRSACVSSTSSPGTVGVVKPQSAFFEACGPAGLATLQTVIRRAKELGLVVILDAKRGDIASTAAAYAAAAFGGTAVGGRPHPVWAADALTVNPYLGRDAVEPFLGSARQAGGGLFVLVRTSNPAPPCSRTSTAGAGSCTGTWPPRWRSGMPAAWGRAGSATSVPWSGPRTRTSWPNPSGAAERLVPRPRLRGPGRVGPRRGRRLSSRRARGR